MEPTRKTNLLALVIGLTFWPVISPEEVEAGQPKQPTEFSICYVGNGEVELRVKVNAACRWRIEASDEVDGPFRPTDLAGLGGKRMRLQIPADKPRQFYRLALERKQD